MSAPIRDRVCGCIVASRYNRYDKKPFYCSYGKDVVTETQNCVRHKRIHHKKEIILFGKVIGYLEWNEGNFSSCICVPSEEYVKYFPFKDVYVNDLEYWSFKDHRKYSAELARCR